jgi:predicted membrane protein
MIAITPETANLIGFAGSFCIVAAFIYANRAKQMDKLTYNLANLLGAALLTISLLVNYNLPTLVLEIVWMTIAVYGIVVALRERAAARKEAST